MLENEEVHNDLVNPGPRKIKKVDPWKSMVYRIMSQSAGESRSLTDIAKGFFDELRSKPYDSQYTGSYIGALEDGESEGTPDLNWLVTFGNTKGEFTPKTLNPNGFTYEEYLKKNYDTSTLPAYEGNIINASKVRIPQEYKPLVEYLADNPQLGYYAETNHPGDDEIDDETYPLKSVHDVNSYRRSFRRDANGNPELAAQDIIDYGGGDYSRKWGTWAGLQGAVLNSSINSPVILDQSVPVQYGDPTSSFDNGYYGTLRNFVDNNRILRRMYAPGEVVINPEADYEYPLLLPEVIVYGKKRKHGNYNPDRRETKQPDPEERPDYTGRKSKSRYNFRGTGGSLNTIESQNKDWNSLSLKEKSDIIRVAIKNGITTLPQIKEKFNEFANGGNLYGDGGYIWQVLPGLLRDAGLDIRVTSGYRKAGAVGKAGTKSWHWRNGAVDIVPQGKTTFEDIERVVRENPTVRNYLLSNGFGFLDETNRTAAGKALMGKTGATGNHFHFGRDRSAQRHLREHLGLNGGSTKTASYVPEIPEGYVFPEEAGRNNPYARQAERMWSKAQPIYQEMLDAGIDPVSAAGILGNMALESGLNPAASNNINGGHWGYLQNDRNITPWIKSNYGGYDHRHQMDYLIAGMQGRLPQGNMGLASRFNGYRDAMRGVTDPEMAAYLWERHYEKSDNEAIPARKGYARYFYDRMMGSNPSIAQQGATQGEDLAFTPWNSDVFFNGYNQPVPLDIPEVPQQGPVETEAMRAYRQKVEERQQAADNWNKFNFLMQMTSPQQDSSPVDAFGMLASSGYGASPTSSYSDLGPIAAIGNMFAKGGKKDIPQIPVDLSALEQYNNWYTPVLPTLPQLPDNTQYVWSEEKGLRPFAGYIVDKDDFLKMQDKQGNKYDFVVSDKGFPEGAVATGLKNPMERANRDAAIEQARKNEEAQRAAERSDLSPLFAGIMAGHAALPYVGPVMGTLGRGAATLLSNPWVDAGLTSYFGAEGLQDLANGNADWMTALEVAPLGRLAKPVYTGVVNTIDNIYRNLPWTYRIPEDSRMAYRIMGPLERDWIMKGNELSTRKTNPLTVEEERIASAAKTGKRSFSLFKAGAEHGGRKQFAKGQPWGGTTVTHGEKQILAIPGKDLPWVSGRHFEGPQGHGFKVGGVPFEDAPFGSHIDLLTEEGYTGVNPSLLKSSVIYSPYKIFGHKFGYKKLYPKISTTPQITAENAASMTPEQWTAAQDAAIAKGDVAEAQRLADLHAEIKGYNSSLPLYHGSPQKDITAFNPDAEAGTLEGSGGTTFFTPNFDAADTYARGKGIFEMTNDPGRVYKVYSAHKNPKVVSYDGASYLGTGTKLTIDAGDGTIRRILNPKGGSHFLDDSAVYAYDSLPIEGLEYPKYYAPPRNKHIIWEKEKVAGSASEEAAKAMSEGYDVAILKNVDEGIGPNNAKIGPIDDYAIRDTRLVKLADAVTYDNNGIRIPLGERHNFNINDIRYGWLPWLLGGGTAASLYPWGNNPDTMK